ncbi:cytochrome c biogenesis protein ResB [Planctomyces sp. SH-PL62]|uniref:cytochrome c biogenesis protein ResB n=1 Tax=Planctomyces sp. SH-PL62 TaxID=1636152 RepID=UPI00078DD02F|nr:cytochrome c biogenesis protein ResB [Planctomyces sp. SH-PL62]AMV38545.1 Cytochrome c biogenesis protein Ccs1 [Planctomyces sp. SH-PL62]
MRHHGDGHQKAPRPRPSAPSPGRSIGGRILGAIDAIYKFLASLKLAVLSLSSLAAALAFATWFESTYGTRAVQSFVYKSAGFAVLLAFLAINIFCAASIRFPWKKRQTGFVITHAGLLVLIAGSYVHFKSGDEGMVGMLEGESRSEMLRTDAPMFRLREVDPHTQKPSANYELPFDESGPFPWGGGSQRIRNLFDLTLNRLTGGRYPIVRDEADVLSKAGDPFKFVVKQYLPAATPDTVRRSDPSGQPMARLLLRFKAPGMPDARLANAEDAAQWFQLDRRFYRTARSDGMPALVSFSYVDRPEYVEDFLKPPLAESAVGVARIRYRDKDGKERSHDFKLETPADQPVPLPDSDLIVSLQKLANFPTAEAGLARVVGADSIPIAVFDVRKGDAPVVEHVAMGAMPMFPNIIPRPTVDGGKPPEALVRIHLMLPPDLDPKSSGLFGQIDVLATPEKTLYQRVFGRGKDGKPELRSAGPIETGKWIDAFGGGAGAAMTIGFQVGEYLPTAVEKRIFRPLFLIGSQMDEAIPACLVELTVDGKTEEIWIQRSEALEAPVFRPVPFGGRLFEIAYDADRRPLGFDLTLEDFEVGFEPGTEQATKFVSQVKVDDLSQGVRDQLHTISMNEPMTHRGLTFYQMRYSPIVDPRTNQRTGQFQSVFQVGSNPGRPIIYAGSLLIVLGTFVQFYMRAGLFTDGGKREREQAAKKAGAPTPVEPPTPAQSDEDIL